MDTAPANQETYVVASPEVEALLADNDVDLPALLREEGLEVGSRLAPNPTQPSDSGEKEVVTIILASAAVVAVLTPTITRIIGALTHRPVLVKESIAVPVEDSSGNVVHDAKGQPMLRWVERSRYVETTGEAPRPSPVKVSGPVGVTIELG